MEFEETLKGFRPGESGSIVFQLPEPISEDEISRMRDGLRQMGFLPGRITQSGSQVQVEIIRLSGIGFGWDSLLWIFPPAAVLYQVFKNWGTIKWAAIIGVVAVGVFVVWRMRR